MRPSSGFAPLLSNRIPIIRLGQSNIAGCYENASAWPIVQQQQQDAIQCYVRYCAPNGSSQPNGTNAERDTWERMQPRPIGTPETGPVMGHWGLDLAGGLSAIGLRVAMMDYCIGATALAYFTPSATGTNYPAILSWIQARLAQLTTPKQPIVVMYQGESGLGSGIANWQTGFAALMAALRAALGYPTMGAVVVGLPATYSSGATIRGQQATYVGSDVHSYLAFDDVATFAPAPALAGIHVDMTSGRRLAAGATTSNTHSVFAGIKSILGVS